MSRLSEILKTNSSIRWRQASNNIVVRAGEGVVAFQNIRVTLPADAMLGDVVQVILINNSEVEIARNTKLINSVDSNIFLTKTSLIHTLIFAGNVYGWYYSAGENTVEFAQNLTGNPGLNKYYGTNAEGLKGYFDVPDINKARIPVASMKDICAIVTAALTL